MDDENFLYLTRLGIDTHQEPVVYMREDCHVCRSEGFNAQSRVLVSTGSASIIATLDVVCGDFLSHQCAGLSESAWHRLGAREGERARFRHASPVESMSHVRGKLYDQPLSDEGARQVIRDIHEGRYSDIQLAAYISACAANRLGFAEMQAITRAMVEVGSRLDWGERATVMDKHCVGGLPGNRTTPIIVAIVAANGLMMPKTSSRAITSPAGTADTMETLTPVELTIDQMRTVVEREGACLVWGGGVSLSPADDVIIRVERALDIDSEGQLVASVISKKVAAGANHVLLDLPVGPTAKVRSEALARRLSRALAETGGKLGLDTAIVHTDGSQPIGRGIGPALEARDILAVLENATAAPADLRDKSLMLAGRLLEMGGACERGAGESLARRTLESGRALAKFEAICKAQGGLRSPPTARFTRVFRARQSGVVRQFNNRVISRLASLAGAPGAPAAGLELHVRVGDRVDRGQPLMTLHAEARGELEYALDFLNGHLHAIQMEEDTV